MGLCWKAADPGKMSNCFPVVESLSWNASHQFLATENADFSGQFQANGKLNLPEPVLANQTSDLILGCLMVFFKTPGQPQENPRKP